MKLNWNFLGGGGWGMQNKETFRGGEYGYFLELHIVFLKIILWCRYRRNALLIQIGVEIVWGNVD